MKPLHAAQPRARIIGPVLLAGWLCAASPPAGAQPVQAFSTAAGAQPPAPWHVSGLAGSSSKPVTRFDIVTLDGERVLRVIPDKSYGTLRHDLPGLAISPVSALRWRWRLDQPLRDADLREKRGDDSPLKICALFDMPSDGLDFHDRAFLFAARHIDREYVPAATLCYVWDHRLPVGTELPNAFTRRVRYVVLNSGDSQLKTWIAHERDLTADFMRAFGAETRTVPPLIGLVVGADADNTAARSLAYVSDLSLQRVPPVAAK